MSFPWIPAIIILIAAILAAGCATSPTVTPASPVDIRYDVLIPLTGVASPFGESSKAALDIAADDINRYYNDTGSPNRIHLVFHDTATDPATSRSLARQIHDTGGRIILGYMTSAELRSMKNDTDARGMIVISSGSTSPTLAIPGDSIYRVVSDDSAQGRAMAAYLVRENVTAIVPLWRGDLWGDDLKDATEQAFAAEGGVTTRGVRYLPEDPDINATVLALDLLTGNTIEKYGANRTGVYAVTFNEIADIMKRAENTGNLSRLRWFGSDGNTGIPQLTGTGPAARFADETNFTGIIWGVSGSRPGDAAVIDRITKRLGREPDGQAIALYDTLWVLADMHCDIRNATNQDQIARALNHYFNSSIGVSQEMALNDAGDRVLASYDITRAGPGTSGTKWYHIGEMEI